MSIVTFDPLNPPTPNYSPTVPPVVVPSAPVLGRPSTMKETAQRTQFKTDQFVIAIEANGYRLAWTRAAPCPCKPLNRQTKQPDPTCPYCNGTGYFYFGTSTPQPASEIGQLNDAQKLLLQYTGAYVIKGMMTSLTQEKSDVMEKIGGWRTGSANVSVRAENKLAYYDRLVAIDSTIAYPEIVYADGTEWLRTRYVVNGGVNLLMGDNFKPYVAGNDFTVQNGRIRWMIKSLPPPKTRLTIHYMTNPTWLVTSHPHTIRNVYILNKVPLPSTPEGDLFDLPLFAICQLEFLVHPNEMPPPVAVGA